MSEMSEMSEMREMSEITTIAEVILAAASMRQVYRESRCPCGCGGSWRRTVSGTIGGQPALWMGCSRRGGVAVGGGLTGAQREVALAVLAACERLDIGIDAVMDSGLARPLGLWIEVVTGDLAVEAERRELAGVVAEWAKPAGQRSRAAREPAAWVASRRWEVRDLDVASVTDGIWEPASV